MKKRRKPKKKPQKVMGMVAAAAVIGASIDEVKRAKRAGCPAFSVSGSCDCEALKKWLADNPSRKSEDDSKAFQKRRAEQRGGISEAWKRVKANEVDCHARYISLRDDLNSDQTTIGRAFEQWQESLKALRIFDKSVDASQKSDDEQIPKADVIAQIRALFAWHRIGVSDAIHNFVPRLVGVSSTVDAAAIIDPIMRESMALALDIGRREGKLQDWLVEAAQS